MHKLPLRVHRWSIRANHRNWWQTVTDVGPRTHFLQRIDGLFPLAAISHLIPFSPCAGAEELEKLVAGMPVVQLEELARKKCLGGSGWPERVCVGASAAEATNELVHALKVIVHDLFTKHRSEVRWVSETAQLDQEEAAGGELLQWSPATARLGFEPPAS